MNTLGIGIDIGGTVIKGAIFDLNYGSVIQKETVATQTEGKVNGMPAFAVQVRDMIDRLEEEAGGEATVIGISAPGLASRDASSIESMPGRLSGLEGLKWEKFLDRECSVLNDAHAGLMGEIWMGSAKGLRDVIFITLGTGVGGAVVSHGQLMRGHIGRAGHVGHISLNYQGPGDICSAPGSLEDLVGNHNVKERSGGRFDSTADLVAAVENGDEDAERVWDESMKALAAGIASLINILDPQAVIIGGGISQAWDSIQPRLMKWMDEFEWRPGGVRVQLRRATLEEWAGTYGAVYFAMMSP